MYCTGDPNPVSVTGDTFCKLGKNIPEYTFKKMWAGPPVLDGICDVEESITGLIRTDGPTITLHGAWAQNIGKGEMYIDFMGDKGGVRLIYGKDFTYFTALNGELIEETPEIDYSNNFADMFQNEINSFVRCIETGEKLPSHIDSAIKTSKIMQAIYDSSDAKKEIRL